MDPTVPLMAAKVCIGSLHWVSELLGWDRRVRDPGSLQGRAVIGGLEIEVPAEVRGGRQAAETLKASV